MPVFPEQKEGESITDLFAIAMKQLEGTLPDSRSLEFKVQALVRYFPAVNKLLPEMFHLRRSLSLYLSFGTNRSLKFEKILD